MRLMCCRFDARGHVVDCTVLHAHVGSRGQGTIPTGAQGMTNAGAMKFYPFIKFVGFPGSSIATTIPFPRL